MKTMTESKTLGYEESLRNEVGRWLEKLCSTIEPNEKIYISVDGPVPCAKIQQQRQRRYKSQWLIRHENEIRRQLNMEEKPAGWDRNAITPGTDFMSKLDKFLEKWGRDYAKKTGLEVQVSPSSEPGEGEHKIMLWLRQVKNKNVVVYGLDADLILLGMLHSQLTQNNIILCREHGEGVAENVDMLTFQFFNPIAAAEGLRDDTGSKAACSLQEWIYDYVAIMSFLGNDFLPHSLGFSIRDGAIRNLLVALEESVREVGARLWDISRDSLSVDVLYCLLRRLAKTEEKNVGHWLLAKAKWRPPILRESEPLARALEDEGNRPMRLDSEGFLFNEGRTWCRSDWRSVYERKHFGEKAEDAAVEFLRGISWIRAYYWDSSSVDIRWYYPYSEAPTFQRLLETLTLKGLPPAPARAVGLAITPLEQLIMVLPPQSFELLPARIREKVKQKARFYLPVDFELEYFGKHALWASPPRIPFLPHELVKQIVAVA